MDGADIAPAAFMRDPHGLEVLRLQGPPDLIDGWGPFEVWRYGRSNLGISTRDGLVQQWDSEGNLKVR